MTLKAWLTNVYIPRLETRLTASRVTPERAEEIQLVIDELRAELARREAQGGD